jgi:hypothetical protein
MGEFRHQSRVRVSRRKKADRQVLISYKAYMLLVQNDTNITSTLFRLMFRIELK